MESTTTPSPAPLAPSANRSGGRRYTTISIPQQLYEDIKRAIDGTGFRSPTEYLVYITRLSLQSNNGEPAAAPANPLLPKPRTVPYR